MGYDLEMIGDFQLFCCLLLFTACVWTWNKFQYFEMFISCPCFWDARLGYRHTCTRGLVWCFHVKGCVCAWRLSVKKRLSYLVSRVVCLNVSALERRNESSISACAASLSQTLLSRTLNSIWRKMRPDRQRGNQRLSFERFCLDLKWKIVPLEAEQHHGYMVLQLHDG